MISFSNRCARFSVLAVGLCFFFVKRKAVMIVRSFQLLLGLVLLNVQVVLGDEIGPTVVVPAVDIEVLNPSYCVDPANPGMVMCPIVQDVACPGGSCWSPIGAILWLCVDGNQNIVPAEIIGAGNGNVMLPDYAEAAPGVPGKGLTALEPIVCHTRRFCRCSNLIGNVRHCKNSGSVAEFVIVPYEIEDGVACVNAGITPL